MVSGEMMMEQLGLKKMQGSIVEMLKEEILSGHIACGTEMTQNELSVSLGVSRMPVREALIILEYQGLIKRLPNNHVRVAEFSADYFQKIFGLCAELELNVLWEMTEAQPKFLPSSGELEFHREVYRASSHSYIRKTLQTITEIYIGFACNCQTYDKKRGQDLLQQVTERMCKGVYGQVCTFAHTGDTGIYIGTDPDTGTSTGPDACPDTGTFTGSGAGEIRSLLNRYFDGLAEAIMRERMG